MLMTKLHMSDPLIFSLEYKQKMSWNINIIFLISHHREAAPSQSGRLRGPPSQFGSHGNQSLSFRAPAEPLTSGQIGGRRQIGNER